MKRIKKIAKIFLIIFASLIVLAVIASTINNRIGNCSIKGEIEGLGTRLALVNGGNNSGGEIFFKLLLVVNGKFSFNVKLDKPGGGRLITRNMFFQRASGKPLWMRSKLIDFDIAPNEEIAINGSLRDYSIDYLITGNNIASESSKLRANNLHILEKETQLAILVDSLRFNNSNKTVLDSAQREFNNIRREYANKRLEYVVKNPNQTLSATYLGKQHKDTIMKYLPTLGENVLATYQGKILQERANVYKQTKAGKLAPNIIDGSTFNLSDLKGKYVVLDFWGTWCGGCVKGFPKMRTYYNKYRTKVEFVGIACKDKKSVWEKFIKREGLQWTQLLNNPEKDFEKLYDIQVYPTKIIIDKEGNIVKIYEGESQDFYDKLDELMQG
ncbi:TlpA family protein disulfide reductase [uncultured Sunxiuqinia sp.]|uniref:TlpA family protein disulfide reductase n=1 Tax=Sunxiuqinia rutila TaxID=1397841 RepID=UPI00262824F0|nr:TlpA disulfide reductase family protein [uncultured Sunxiuqinia sp.]